MNAFPLHRYSFDDYLRFEAESPTRHEFLAGEILAMAGGTPEHAALAMAIGRQLGNQLAGTSCRVYSSDLRVHIDATTLSTYPDVTVICGPSQRHPNSPTTVVNPILVVEVTSDSTESYDRGAKLEHYMKVPSLRCVVIVSHRKRQIDVHEFNERWSHRVAERGEQVSVPSVGISLDVDTLCSAAEEPAA